MTKSLNAEELINDENYQNMSVSEKALRALINARKFAMLVSSPGKAKTATIRQIAKDMGYDLITIVASRMDAQDISGFPTKGTIERTNEKGELVELPATEYAPQMWQHYVMEHKKVILFLDEFSNAHPSTRASFLSFIQDRQFPNGDNFPEETIMVGAMNPSDSAADGYELDKATSNRITFLAWEPSFIGWCEGFKRDNFGEGWINEKHEEYANFIIQFITDNRGMLHQENDASIGTGEALGVDISDSSQKAVLDYAWPSRRSWHNAAAILAADTSESQYVEDELLKGTVGARAATHFRKWLESHSRLDVSGIIENPDKFKGWDKLSVSDVTTILSSAIDGVDKDNVYNVIRIFEIIAEGERASYAASHIRDLTTCHKSFKHLLSKDEQAKLRGRLVEVVAKFKDITKTH